MGASRSEQTPSEVSQLKNKVKSLEVMLQKLQIDNKPEPEENDMEVFLRHMAVEYTQSKGPAKKKLGFKKSR